MIYSIIGPVSMPTSNVFGDVSRILSDISLLNKVYTTEEIAQFDIAFHWNCIKIKIYSMHSSQIHLIDITNAKYDEMIPYCNLVIEKLAERFLEHLNINNINKQSFSPEFIEYANKYTDFPILLKALNQS